MRFHSSSKFSGFPSDRRIPTPVSYLGVFTHFATLIAGVHPVSRASQAPHVPPLLFLTTSTVYSSTYLAGLFHPAATCWVCSVGVFPLTQPYELIARRCPLVVRAFSLPSADQRHQNQCVRLQGFAPCENSCWTAGGLDQQPIDPLVSFSFLGSFFVQSTGSFLTDPPTAFSGPRRIMVARPDVLLRERLPRLRFMA
jgi:hypothetical protein